MNVGEIVKDAVRYPLSDWKKILILGVIIIISSITGIFTSLGTTNIYLTSFLSIIGFVIGLLVNGYMFRIIKFSMDGKLELPEFNDWVNMGADGVKVFIAFIIYLVIPSLFILFLVPLLSGFDTTFVGSEFTYFLGSIGLTPLTFLIHSLISVIWPGILTLIAISYDIFPGIFALIYIIVIIPIFLVAIANMAYYEGEFRSTFRFCEVFGEIRSIGWAKLIVWYVLMGIIGLIILIIESLVGYISILINLNVVVGIIVSLSLSLTLIPYFYMYIARSVALFYMPDKED